MQSLNEITHFFPLQKDFHSRMCVGKRLIGLSVCASDVTTELQVRWVLVTNLFTNSE